MRLFYFLLFIPILSFGAPPNCDQSDLVPGATLAGVCTSLTINSDVLLGGAGGGAIEITGITGNVTINADIILDGGNGTTITVDGTPGGTGGPGAFSDGGGLIGTTAQPSGFDPEDGPAGVVDAACSSGAGGGGGVSAAGTNGFACPLGASTPPIPSSQAAFPIPIRGGHGGGAGGEKNIGVFDLGGGGGGGGGIYIQAAGTITIANGVTLSARGGRGGNSVNIGGAGGGGAGGVIHLESAIGITNQGIVDVRGGDGGSVRAASPKGGIGGAGGSGVFRTQIGANPPTDLTGRQDFSTGLPTSSSSALKSDISCGTVAKNEDRNLSFQIAIGFMISLLLGYVLKFRAYSR